MALARVNTPIGNGSNLIIVVLPTQNGTLTYNGTNQKPVWTNYNPDQMTMTGETEAITAGVRTVYCTPTGNYVWANGTQETKETAWTINKAAGVLSLSTNSAEIKVGTTSNIILTTAGDGAITVTSNNTNVATVSRNGNTITITGVKAGTANITVSVAEGTNHLAPSSVTCSVTVSKTLVTIPTVTNTSKTYNGSNQSPTVTNEPSSTVATCTGKSATNAGDYTLKYALIDTNKYSWSDGSITDKTTPWSIAKANGSVTLSATSGTITYGTSQTFTVTGNTSGGALSVSSSSTTYATASISSNTVTVNCVNYRSTTTVITVTSAETLNYKAATATYTMTAAKAEGSLTLSAISGTVYKDSTTTFTFTAAGDGTVSVVSNNTSVATVSKSGTTITVTGVKAGTATITVSQSAGTNHNAPANQTYTATVELNVSTTLNDNSWSVISDISLLGTGDTYWDVGDAKEITLNGNIGSKLTLSNVTLCVFILQFNYAMNGVAENNIIWGGFKSALTNGKNVALVDEIYGNEFMDGTICFNMNHKGQNDSLSSNGYRGSNYGGWKGSDLRYDILGATSTPPSKYNQLKSTSNVGYDATADTLTNPKADTLLAALPSDLRSVLRLWARYVDADGNNKNTDRNVRTIDAITLLSEFEMRGVTRYAWEYEKNHLTQMEYFVAGNGTGLYHYKYDDTSYPVTWWGCSTYCGTTSTTTEAGKYHFISVDGYANANSSEACCSLALAPAFKT